METGAAGGTEVTEGGKKQQFSWFQTHEELFFLPDQGRQERSFADIDKFGGDAWKVRG